MNVDLVRVLGLLIVASLAPARFASAEALVLRGAEIRTVPSGTIPRGAVVILDGKIAAVGPENEVRVPSGAEVRDVTGRVMIPGLVDTHSHIGIYPRPRVPAHSDGNERSEPRQSALRAIDAIWPADPAIRMAVAGGVTTVNVMPGSGNVIGGQTAYVKLRGDTIEEMLIQADGVQGGMKMANGENPKRAYGSKEKAPVTRMSVAALQRGVFVKAAEYRKKDPDERERDLELEPILEVLDGKRTVHYHTHRADDIMTALRLQEEFGFDLVLQHVSEGYKVADEIASRRVPASIIMLDSPGGKHEAAEFTNENGAILERAGALVAIHTDDFITSSRLFLRSGALAVRAGMSEEGALAALTLNGAKMLRLDDRLGSIEVGKDADLVVLSGPPFSVYTKVLETYIDGERVFDRSDPSDLRYATGGYKVTDRYPDLEVGR
jgi:imidazolonepropionase-like amidohydrolase